jgi:hypothetical protein
MDSYTRTARNFSPTFGTIALLTQTKKELYESAPRRHSSAAAAQSISSADKISAMRSVA